MTFPVFGNEILECIHPTIYCEMRQPNDHMVSSCHSHRAIADERLMCIAHEIPIGGPAQGQEEEALAPPITLLR